VVLDTIDFAKELSTFHEAVVKAERYGSDSTHEAVDAHRKIVVDAYDACLEACVNGGEAATCPEHYSGENGECIEAIRICGWDDGFIKGNILKYLFRHRAKGGVEDLIKARNYIDMLIKEGGE